MRRAFYDIPLLLAVMCFEARGACAQTAVIQHGEASIYANSFRGERTATGALYDPNALTAASRALPLGAKAQVTNLENGKTVTVEINDRGPYAKGRIIDLSKKAADALGVGKKQGVAAVKVEAHAERQPTAELEAEIADMAAAQREKERSAQHNVRKNRAQGHKTH